MGIWLLHLEDSATTNYKLAQVPSVFQLYPITCNLGFLVTELMQYGLYNIWAPDTTTIGCFYFGLSSFFL